MLINGTTQCDCIYISQAAVDAHHLPTPAGWYVEVPDDDVPFSVRFSVIASRYPLTATVLVDGQKAIAYTKTSELTQDVQGIEVGTDAAGRMLTQPFRLKKAAFDHRRDEGDEAEEEGDGVADKSSTVSTIVLEVAESPKSPTPSRPAAPNGRYGSFVERKVVPDKKASFGIERSVSVGPAVSGGIRYSSGYIAGALIKKLEVRYRTAKFFHALQCRIKPPEAERNEDTRETTFIDLVGDEDEDDDDVEEGRERKAKRIKREPIATGARAVRLDTAASVDTFLTRLAEKEDMEMSAFKLLLLELSRRSLTTVGHLRQLTRDQWREMIRVSLMPASLARSAIMLLSTTTTSATSTSDGSASVCIVLDD